MNTYLWILPWLAMTVVAVCLLVLLKRSERREKELLKRNRHLSLICREQVRP